MQSDREKEGAELVCKEMWSEIFGDSKEYISWYFEKKWKENKVFLLRDDVGEICSMLHCNPYEMKIQKKEMLLHYIVGVCTREDQRKKGFMGKLLQECFAWMYEREEPFTYLMPAREGIYEPYDFNRIYQAKKERVGKDLLPEKVSRYQLVDYNHTNIWQKKELETACESWLTSRYSIYACRNQNYFHELAEQMQACHGSCLLIYEGDILKGYLVYGAEEGKVEVFELLGEVNREDIYKTFTGYLKEKGMVSVNGFQINVTPFQGNITENGHSIMARIIHFSKCASLLRSPQPKVWRVRITDSYISQNNGQWELNIGSGGCQVIPLQASETVEKVMDIREFCEFFFANQKVYLNELV